MIKVWLVKSVRSQNEGAETSWPPLEIPLTRAMEKFHLAHEYWIRSLGDPPRLREDCIRLAEFLGYSYVILEVPKNIPDWRAGFYLIPENLLTPTKAYELMTQEGWLPIQSDAR